MPTKSWKIWDNHQIVVPWNWAQNAVSVKQRITWDDRITQVNSIKLQLFVVVSNDYTKFMADLNGVNVAFLNWSMGGGTGSKTALVDITPINGDNEITFIGAKEFANPSEVTFTVTASIVMDYTGIDPHTGPGGIEGTIQEYGGYAVVVAAVIAVIALVARR